jgi:DNA invertase Pin-like site-specific DNA recombinase
MAQKTSGAAIQATGKAFGYARVSTTDQDLSIQRQALLDAGVPEALIFAEKASGTTTDGRDELARLLAMLRAGDVLHVARIDRLARSMHDFARIAHDLKERGIGLRVVLQGIDTTIGGPVGALTMNLLAAFAQFETEIRRERQMEGIARAKAAGAYKGRKPSVSAESVRELHNMGLGPSAIARKLGCGRTTVYRLLDAGLALLTK